MNRLDFYFEQLVTEGDMDLAFDQVQERIEQAASGLEHALDGMITGGNVTENAAPDLNVIVSGDAYGYTPEGKRLFWEDPVTLDCSQDEFGVPTTVATPGNSRWLSIFVEFEADLQDPRLDGNSVLVYFKRLEGVRIFVVQGAEAVTPVKPPLRDDALLLADIILIYGQTSILNADINVDRRQDYLRETGTPQSLIVGTARDALIDLLEYYNAHVTDTADKHADTGVTAAAKSGTAGTIPEPATLAVGSVGSQLQTLLDYVETLTEATITASQVVFTPYDWIAATDVQAAIEEIVDDLAAQSSPSGVERIGTHVITGTITHASSSTTIPANDLHSALGDIMDEIGKRANRNGDIYKGNHYPQTDATGNLGISSNRWGQGHIRSLFMTFMDFVEVGSWGFNSNVKPVSNNTFELGLSSYRWEKLWSVQGDFSSHVDIAGNLDVTLDLSVGSLALFDVSSNDVFFYGDVQFDQIVNLPITYTGFAGNLKPTVGATYDLGATVPGLIRWRDIYFDGKLNAGSGFAGWGVVDFRPDTNAAYDLGTVSYRWQDLWLAGGINSDTTGANQTWTMQAGALYIGSFFMQSSSNVGGFTRYNALLGVDSYELGLKNVGTPVVMMAMQNPPTEVCITAGGAYISQAVGGETFTVNGNAGKTVGGIQWTNLSDQDLKENIEELSDQFGLDNALEKLARLKGYKFTWKDSHLIDLQNDEDKATGQLVNPRLAALSGVPQYGLIAQNVESVFPNWVNVDGQGRKWTNVCGLEGIVIEAFKIVRVKLMNHEQRIQALEAA